MLRRRFSPSCVSPTVCVGAMGHLGAIAGSSSSIPSINSSDCTATTRMPRKANVSVAYGRVSTTTSMSLASHGGKCCRDPASCDTFRDGECWYFAATDTAQVTAHGTYSPGRPLTVGDRPVFSGTGGRVEEMIRRSDLVFATSSLEVGYDDPEITLVYQHYSPGNLASFIQRKGRGGRGADDRPVTGVTLSPYSSRDSWYFRRPGRMLDSSRFEVPVNLDNYFVLRGQALAVVLDCVARFRARNLRSGVDGGPGGPVLPPAVLADADCAVRAVCGDGVYEALQVSNLAEFWEVALETAEAPLALDSEPGHWRSRLPWVPDRLFDEINLPAISVAFDNDQRREVRREALDIAFDATAPGQHDPPLRMADAALDLASQRTLAVASGTDLQGCDQPAGYVRGYWHEGASSRTSQHSARRNWLRSAPRGVYSE